MIKETHVEVVLTHHMIPHYEKLGYVIPLGESRGSMVLKRHTKLTVSVEDLSNGSQVPVTKICDYCGKVLPNKKYCNVIRCRKDGTDACYSCSAARRVSRKMERVGSLADNYPEVAHIWHPSLNGELTARDVMGKSVKKVWWLCDDLLCGNSWQAVICDVSKGSRCPACSRSRGEQKVRAHLINRKVPFITQASVSGLVGVCRGDLLFDFVVTSMSGDWLLAIEYDGIQHSKPVDFAGLGEDDALRVFRRTSIHDQRKTAWALLHGIPLLRISYDDFGNVESILDNALAQLEMFREISADTAA